MHAEVLNRTGFGFTALHTMDEEGRPLVVPIVRATFLVKGGALTPVAPQPDPSLAGELYGEDAATSSYRVEPEIAFVKPGVDCVLVGHAFAPRRDVPCVDVTFRVGPVEKAVRVFGDRVWVRAMGRVGASRPAPFDMMPLRYELAFGGREEGDAERTLVDLRNPVGRGFHAPGHFQEGIALPNLEDPRDPIASFDHVPAPACFGFLSPGWTPRRLFGGTYDDAWVAGRMPMLPKDFDRRFFNAASPGLVASALRGDDLVHVTGTSARGGLSFRLPGLPPPTCRVSLRRGPAVVVATKLGTVLVDADAETVALTWRAHVALTNGPHDVAAIELG